MLKENQTSYKNVFKKFNSIKKQKSSDLKQTRNAASESKMKSPFQRIPRTPDEVRLAYFRKHAYTFHRAERRKSLKYF